MIYYVDHSHPAASDSNPGTEDRPLLTIQRGVDLAEAGDTVRIKGSVNPTDSAAVYNTKGHGIATRRPGQPGQTITMESYPGHTVIIDGGGSHNGIDLTNASYSVFRGITFRNFEKATEGTASPTDILIERCEFTITFETGLRLRNVTNLTMRDCYVHHCSEAGISVRNGNNVLFERVESSYNEHDDGDGFHTISCGKVDFIDCVARGNSDDGFDLTSNSSLTNCVSADNTHCNAKLWRRTDDTFVEKTATFVNSVFRGAGEAGIKVSAGARLYLYNCVVYGNGEEGVAFRAISIGQDPATVTSQITNCIIAGNGHSQRSGAIEVLQSKAGLPKNDVHADHNLYFNNTRDNVGLTSDTNAITGRDPLFLAPAGGNFHLRAGSPAIDAAVPLTAVTVDFDGHPRPFGPAPDIGAFERLAGDAPVAVDDAFTVQGNSGPNSLDVLVNDKPGDATRSLTIVAKTNGAHGTVAISPDGKSLTYTPAAGYGGADRFTYTITDKLNGTATATVNITVAPCRRRSPPPALLLRRKLRGRRD